MVRKSVTTGLEKSTTCSPRASSSRTVQSLSPATLTQISAGRPLAL